MESYNVTFKGYRLDDNKDSLPTYGGVYLVYCCTYNKEEDTVSLKRLIYIGQTINLHDRLCNHDRYDDFKGQLHEGEQLCYSYAAVPLEDKDVIENGLIYMQKPPLNNSLTDIFNYGDSQFIIDGACALLRMKNFSITDRR
jgi:hypothetical protein